MESWLLSVALLLGLWCWCQLSSAAQQLCAARGRGPAGSPRPRRDIPASSCRLCSGKQLAASPTPPLGSAGISAAWWEAPKRLGWWQKKADKSLISSASPLALPGGEGSWPHLLLKDQVEVMAGESPCSLWLVLSDKDRDGLCKYLLSFYSDWFSFSFFFSAFCKCGWDSRERAGSHPLCCLLSQYKNKG